MVLLQTILVLIIVYYLIKFLWRIFAPRVLNYAVKKSEERFQGQFTGYSNSSQKPQNEGETTVHRQPNSSRKSSKKVGEYIDFEEIE